MLSGFELYPRWVPPSFFAISFRLDEQPRKAKRTHYHSSSSAFGMVNAWKNILSVLRILLAGKLQ